MISPHTSSQNLFIATCGSFHGFKFFPVLGKYVIQMLEGTLDPALVKKWAWDRQMPSKEELKSNLDWPRRELSEFLDAE